MNYIHSSALYAEIKEELSSYFNTGAVDDIMFPTWTDYCLKRLKKTTYKIKDTVLEINNHKVSLPDDFNSVRSIWSCNTHYTSVFSPRLKYRQYDIRLTPPKKCEHPQEIPCECDPCNTDAEYQVTDKITQEMILGFKKFHLLKPANSRTKDKCGGNCLNFAPTCYDTFDVDGCNLHTTIDSGMLYMEYYAEVLNDEGNQMIPDNVYIQEYISNYIKFKIFEKLLNSTTDETFNQMSYKYQLAEKNMNQSYVLADIELKKKTRAQMSEDIQKSKRRFNRVRSRYY